MMPVQCRLLYSIRLSNCIPTGRVIRSHSPIGFLTNSWDDTWYHSIMRSSISCFGFSFSCLPAGDWGDCMSRYNEGLERLQRLFGILTTKTSILDDLQAIWLLVFSSLHPITNSKVSISRAVLVIYDYGSKIILPELIRRSIKTNLIHPWSFNSKDPKKKIGLEDYIYIYTYCIYTYRASF